MQRAAARGEEVVDMEMDIVRDGKAIATILGYAGPLRDDAGFPCGAIGVSLDITERKRVEEQVRSLAYRDSLTGLPNRLLFHDRLSMAIASGPPAPARAWPCSSWTSTASRSSTTRSATPSATACCRRWRRACGAACARATASPAWAATSSRVLLQEIDHATGAARRRGEGARGAAGALPPRRARAVRHRQRRRQPVPGGRRHRGDADQARGHRHVPREGVGPRRLPALHAGDERVRAGAPGARERAAPRALARRVPAALPADLRPRHAAACTRWRRCCAGAIPSWACCCPTGSCRSPSRPASWSASGPGCCARRARRSAPGSSAGIPTSAWRSTSRRASSCSPACCRRWRASSTRRAWRPRGSRSRSRRRTPCRTPRCSARPCAAWSAWACASRSTTSAPATRRSAT